MLALCSTPNFTTHLYQVYYTLLSRTLLTHSIIFRLQTDYHLHSTPRVSGRGILPHLGQIISDLGLSGQIDDLFLICMIYKIGMI